MSQEHDDPPALQPLASAEEVDSQVQRGFLLTHSRMSGQKQTLFHLAARVVGLVDLLVDRGLIDRDDLRQYVEQGRAELRDDDVGRGMGFILLKERRNKYDPIPEAKEVDCAARLPLCRAACCSLDVPLAPQDVEEEILRWDMGRPYYLRRASDGYCAHLGRGGGGCLAYGHRPITCRTYSCARDGRIWLDFEARVPNTESIELLLERRDSPQLMEIRLPEKG
jgi:Fe-S-cluster containining protein